MTRWSQERKTSHDETQNRGEVVSKRSDARQAIPGREPQSGRLGRDHQFEEGILYIRVRFTDMTELCWRITTSTLLAEADLSDWEGGNFRQLRVFAQNESGSE